MQDYIELLKNMRLQSAPSYWNYSVSGKAIELKILPSFKKDPEKYRIGVIQAGIIIQNFRLQFMNEEIQPLIQIFPSIMENELVAIFRFSTSNNDFKLNQTSQQKNPLKNDDLISVVELPKSSHLDFIDIPKNSLALCTRSENPFTWLHIGYQAEILIYKRNQKNGNSSYVPYILKDNDEQLAISTLLTENIKPQMVIFNYH